MKAEQQNLALEHEIVGTIPETIESDPTRLRQVLMNLVGNAVKFTQTGSVRIVTDLLETTDRPLLRFKVVDTGIGMTPDQCGKIFEEFVQADTSVTRRFGGTGLGLAISKQLSKALGGEIAADSVPDEGSTFTFTIDPGDVSDIARIDQEQEQATAALRAARQPQNKGVSVYFKPARVLVTDDTEANRQLVSVVLQSAGLTVDQAENGLVALGRVAEQDYDVLLMDMQMPVMDGLTATRKLREQGLTVPIVALTANVMQQHQDRCNDAGCTTFLTKPVNIDRLLETITEFLPTQDPPAEQKNATVLRQCEAASVVDRPRTAVVTTAESTATQSPVERLDSVMKLVDEALSDAPPKSIAPASTPGLQSTLPMDIDEFRNIVCGFVDLLPGMMAQLRQAWESRDFEELHGLAHKLKGTGGTVGFPAFTEPSARLQDNADAEIEEGTETILLTLEALAASVQAPAPV